MNSKLLLLVVSVAAFSSCTTLYKSGQTPDDVYYSPVRSYGEEAKKEEQREVVRTDTYGNRYVYEDRTIRFGINDRRWRYFDNDYAYNPYNYGFNYGYYYNPYFWPYPVYSPVFFTPSNPKNTTPRKINLSGYNSTGYANTNSIPVNSKMGTIRPPARSYNNSNKGSAVGNVIRQIFTPPANSNVNSNNNTYNNNTQQSNNTRTYTPASTPSSSSSSGSSSSGSGGVSRPPRSGGN